MGKLYPELDERLRKFIARQSVFFVATAPCLSGDGTGGHVNVSPKGYRDTFAVLGPLRVAYLDLTGSGAETIAHLRQNGQITIMFCSFDHQTTILRLYGTGRVVLPGTPHWDELAGHFPSSVGTGTDRHGRRAIIDVRLDRIADSCGYAVPVMELAEERDVLARWAEKKSPEQLAQYRAEKNAVSIDGLPGLDPDMAGKPA
ncbi:MAG TPA: pyridoxamine 5'-phosphate oxidase family protein [Streptosporangiaceae bacterium]|nr:pyridoxamine 5'-phosphate oxidase family protein [Streptosporangiaceae bacterium]